MKLLPLLGSLLGLVLLTPSAQAVRFPDGTVAFNSPPQFSEIVNPYPSVSVWNPTYYVILQVPETAGEPLQQIVLTQQPSQETILFEPQATQAYRGKSRREQLGLGAVTFDAQTQTLVVNFEPPVPPGTPVTLAVSPLYNPRWDGVYLFGITAFPAGEKPRGQYIGTGRLQFYRSYDLW